VTAAYFVQNTVAAYERQRSAALRSDSSSDDNSKECTNLAVLISELYNFQVISCVLIFDIVRGILDEQLTEFDVELLLKIVRSI
jgi:nucleolar MIF4G domain-containing protein 1